MNAPKTLIFMAGLLLFGVATGAMAQPRAGNEFSFIVSKLKADGITPSTIQWTDVETMCLSLRAESPDDYNQCRYEKAKLQADFRDDSAMCEDAARAFNPNHLRYQAVVVDVPTNTTNSPAVSSVTTLLNTTPAVNDAKAFRRYVFNQCMLERGWRNPRDYRRGYAQ